MKRAIILLIAVIALACLSGGMEQTSSAELNSFCHAGRWFTAEAAR